ncbi:hypothetical protein ACSQ67_011905 [Phaseolus vulgaris]
MKFNKFRIRSYEGQYDRAQVEDLERRCEVVELKNELVGVIQGSIKLVAVQGHPPNNFGKGRTCPWPKGITPSPKKRDWLKPCEKARRMVHFQGCGLCIYGNRKRQPSLDGQVPNSWAMLSVWNSGEIFKLRLGKAPFSCLLCTKSWWLIDKVFPCLKLPTIPDFFNPFGFYFMYGVHHEGPFSGKLVRALCQFVHNMAAESKDDNCKIIVSEVGGRDELNHHIPHWKLLSCPEDLWCIKSLKNEGQITSSMN